MAPSPIPTPTPTPAPTPSPASYPSAFSFSSTASYPSPAAELVFVHIRQPNGPGTDTYEGGTATLLANAGAATISWSADTSSAATMMGQRLLSYPASSLTASVEGARTFRVFDAARVGYRDLTWTHLPGSTALAVILEDEFVCPPEPQPIPERCDESIRYFLAGPPTLAGDLSLTGSARFPGLLQVNTVPKLGRGLSMSFDVTVDYDRGTVSADGIYSTADSNGVITRQHYVLTGTLRRDLSLRLSGTFQIADTDIKGTFVGDLYGAQGHDLGLIFRMDGLGSQGVGLFTAYRQ